MQGGFGNSIADEKKNASAIQIGVGLFVQGPFRRQHGAKSAKVPSCWKFEGFRHFLISSKVVCDNARTDRKLCGRSDISHVWTGRLAGAVCLP